MNPAHARTAVVTGANRGIGREVARGLLAAGLRVVLLCRDRARGEATIRELDAHEHATVVPCDLSDLGSVAEAAAAVREHAGRVDVLVHNAGAFVPHLTHTPQGYETTFAVDVLGPFLLTRRLAPLLPHGARVVHLAGIYHLEGELVFDDLHFERRAYDPAIANAQAQLARVVMAFAWSRRLAERGVSVTAVHPGPVLTDALKDAPWVAQIVAHTLARPAFHDPPAGAEPVLKLALDPHQVTGMFLRRFDLHPSTPVAHDLRVAERLWEACEAMLAVADLA